MRRSARLVVLPLAMLIMFISVFLGISMLSTVANANPVYLSGITISPSTVSVGLGKIRQFTVTGTYSDGTTQDLTSSSTYMSSNPSVATINASGTVTGISLGTVKITAMNSGLIATSKLTVIQPVLSSISVTPANASVVVSLTQQFTVTGTYSDGTTQDLTSSSTYMSSNPSVATINASGTVTGISLGTVKITAMNSGLIATSKLTVIQPVLSSISVIPANASVAAGLTQQFSVTGTYSDNTTQNLTSSSTFTSSNTNVATINASGVVTAVAAGTATITATNGGVSANATLVVISDSYEPDNNASQAAALIINVPQVHTIYPAMDKDWVKFDAVAGKDYMIQIASLSVNTNLYCYLYGTNGTTWLGYGNNLGHPLVWKAPASGTYYLNSGHYDYWYGTGAYSITVQELTTPLPIASISIAPIDAFMMVGEQNWFSVTGIMPDNSTLDLSKVSVYTFSNTTTASVNESGMATGMAPGTTILSASYNGLIATASLTVTPAIASISISPTSSTLIVGDVQQFTVTAIYVDGSTRDITSLASIWPTSWSVAEIGTTPNSFTMIREGITLVSAYYNGFSADARLTVYPPLTGISISPAMASIGQGRQQQYTVIATASGGLTFDTTSKAIYTSSNPSVATISNTGFITTTSFGTTTITASKGGFMSTATLEVRVPIASITVSAASSTIEIGQSQQYSVTGTDMNGVVKNITSIVTITSSNSGITKIDSDNLIKALASGMTTINISIDGVSVNIPLKIIPYAGPVPSLVLPVTTAAVTDVVSSTAFLYSGPNPVQIGMAANTIKPAQTAIIRGKVMDNASAPISGVQITILNHPEYGFTVSRTDGMFDMVVNGGGYLTINYEKAGYMTLQRQVNTPWKDYTWVDDVIMMPYDTKVTTIDLASATSIQVVQGSTVTDADGTRKATLLFSPSTSAMMVMSDGSTQPLTTLNIRATEYTVGTNGPKSMPGALPPTSGYTYAVELSADEAVAAGAATVQFSQPVYNYVENFLNFPVGTIVPSGYYDKQKGAWVPSKNGLVIKILSITNGMADIGIDGSGITATPASMSVLGITDEERTKLATLYISGQSLWRVPIDHFTPWDHNWPYGPPPDGVPPEEWLQLMEEMKAKKEKCGSTEEGSIIECENQLLGERLPVAGTPFTLNYRSDRVQGYIAGKTLDIQLSGTSVPASLAQIELVVKVAGQTFSQTFPPNPNQKYTFTWNGKDGYGRIIQGAQKIYYSIGYTYQPVYYSSESQWENSFGSNSGVPITGGRGQITFITLWRDNQTVLDGIMDTKTAQQSGSWTFDVNHTYDPINKVLYLGDGSRNDLKGISIIDTVVGNNRTEYGMGGFAGDGGSATQAQLNYPSNMAVGSDGTLYIADTWNNRIRAVGPDGNIRTVAGNGDASFWGWNGDGAPATLAVVSNPQGVVVGKDGSLYILESTSVRKVSPNGIITTIAGNGTSGFSGDGGPALLAQFNLPQDIALGPDGSIYISDMNNNCIRHIDTNGIINTVAGIGYFSWWSSGPGSNNNWQGGYNGDGIPATQAKLNQPIGIDIGPDGTLYIADSMNMRVRAVGTDGIIRTVAGNGVFDPNNLDGKIASQSAISQPMDIAVDLIGNLYIAMFATVISVGTDGIITTAAGNGKYGNSGDKGPAIKAQVGVLSSISFENRDRSLYITDRSLSIIHKVYNVMMTGNNITSRDGSEIYVFDTTGKHIKTLDARTNTALYTFSYNTQGLLTSVADQHGNVTTIQRNASGIATSITAPGGQVTTLSMNANGYLSGVSNPAGETYQVTYTNDGLLTSFADPKGNTSTMTYDGRGKLINDQNAGGGSSTLGRADISNGYVNSLASAMGRTTTYKHESLTNGSHKSTITHPSSTQTVTVRNLDGSTTITSPDGTMTSSIQGPDPRFGMQAPIIASMSVVTPGNLKINTLASRSVVLSDPANILSLLSETNVISVNGKVTTMTYASASRQVTTTSPMGKTSVMTLDSLGQPVLQQSGTLEPVSYTYDTKGRLVDMTTGSRSVVYAYNNLNQLVSVTDPTGRVTGYTYDLAGRVTQQTLPDNRVIGYSYDANGNLTGVTPPGKSTHGFTYTNVDLTSQYLPPALGTASVSTTYAYNLDKQLTTVTRPDGQAISMGYDAGGRLSAIATPSGSISYIYNASTGNVVSVTAPNSEATGYTYDGSLVTSQSWTGAVNGNVGYVYNNDFKVASETVNGANTVGYTYDNDGMLTNAGNLAITRDTQNGLLTGTTLNTITTANTYNTLGELTGYNASSGVTALYGAQYTRDNLGRITQKTEIINGITNVYNYAYDTAGRLITVSKNNVVVNNYTYDSNGNRQNNNATYDAQDRLLSYGANTYVYTANGELQSKTNASGTTQYVYDIMGNLTSVTLPNGTLIEYVIDAQNRKIGKKVNGTLVQGFLYENQLNPIAELDGAGNVVSRFVYGTKANVPDYMVKNGVTYRIISDHLGSPKLVVDTTSGIIVQEIAYDEFGNVLSDTNPGFIPFGFAGGIYDQHTKLVRFGARDYDSESGRWTAKDPIQFGGGDTNLYGYVVNDPVNLIDPNGMYFWVIVNAALDVADQLSENGGDWGCIDWWKVAANTINPFSKLGKLNKAMNFANKTGKKVDRTEPANLLEQMTMDAAKKGAGKEIMEGTKWKDPQFQGEGWIKIQYSVKTKYGDKATVHYMENTVTGETTQFKFK